jgi:ribose 5-phosphate isomerase A
MEAEELKQMAAFEAVKHVKSNMVLGLGTGSTTKYALKEIGRLYKEKELENIVGIPSSVQTETLAKKYGIPLSTINDHPRIDLTIDGADEVDKYLNLIKGGGGALLREKVIAQNSKKNIIIIDESKLSNRLGEKWAVPVEVLEFALESERIYLEELGASVKLRLDSNGNPYATDEGNRILDADFRIIHNPFELDIKLSSRAGIVEHGLFIHLATKIIIASKQGLKFIEKN